jgi:hypothetical protein
VANARVCKYMGSFELQLTEKIVIRLFGPYAKLGYERKISIRYTTYELSGNSLWVLTQLLPTSFNLVL